MVWIDPQQSLHSKKKKTHQSSSVIREYILLIKYRHMGLVAMIIENARQVLPG